MRARDVLSPRLLAAAAVVVAPLVSCTAFVVSQLNSYQGQGPAQGGCFSLPSNTCGGCIASSCEAPDASPPVSLQAVCGFQGSGLPYDTRQCATDPSIGSGGYDNCTSVFLEGGAYANTIDTQGTAENNVRKCISDHCFDQCRICTATVYPCGSDQVDLAEAGACGACLYGAMNYGGACQNLVIPTCGYEIQQDVASCAISTASGACNAKDCTNLQSPPTTLNAQAQAALSCLWSNCGSACP